MSDRTKTPDDYHELATSFGFKWSRQFPPTIYDLTRWLCVQGHLFDVSYYDLNRCPYCADPNLKYDE